MSAEPGRRPAPFGSAVVAIGLNTFREAVRDRVMYLILVFALILILVSRLLSMLTVGEEGRIIKDVGLSAISIFGVLIAVFVGVSLVFKEIEKRTIYTLLANPVRRWQFVAGKYAGLLLVLAMNVLIMTALLLLVLLVRGESMAGIPTAALMIFVELSLVTAFALLFSSFANPILAAVGTATVYVTGHLTWSFELLKSRLPEGFGRTLCDVLYWVLPNLGFLNIKSQVVHGAALPDGYLVSALLYGLGYSLVAITAACIVFERRDFN